jgi:FkbM family methyltransferase
MKPRRKCSPLADPAKLKIQLWELRWSRDLQGPASFGHRGTYMQPLDTLSFILNHPLGKQHPLAALKRFVRWQAISRFHDETIVDWIDGSVLGVKRGMTGATGNVYCGLHEFVEMAFLLHFLQPGDVFLDIGANVGSYTILASKVCGAFSIAFEPDPLTARALHRNLALNALEDRVRVEQIALGAHSGEISFTVGLDTMNRVATVDDQKTQIVTVKRLDDIPRVDTAVFAKLDVEGFEDEVLKGGMSILSSPNLLAIQCESHGLTTKHALVSHGFEEHFYDPFSRDLSRKPFDTRASNTLFVRDAEQVIRRVKGAPRRKVWQSMI